ncbi:AAA family ATPase [Mucilaginibacter rubeus]|uniref:AAA family ATPase n=1 Tax=Mucilaginibacter rubeus TaxID=2027860 RepID=A0AAE6JE60_9SPHI|nr:MULTISPECIES: AAA family ATPase [Mucilaginibacter]QEM03736.1 AAA family ATPase [Mucilaginibacter rubeus]QEM16347.1 AAA family ATPase [Mucilaginibacter gossypii]QTE40886.1 AAA family ATPase [Mucilaginibacter rubeus]QTE47489.1 AAA family ATPase [Mucilaginibacter rubeus]QTE58881.1 AAA family ATPase [Mucilaginibacter rubeus]
MQVSRISINNFRGIKEAVIYISGHTVFIGDNNAGKSTIFEAIDLVLGPDRLGRTPVVDEHDFFNGKYIKDDKPIEISVEVVITGLHKEQVRRFRNHIEYWDNDLCELFEEPPAELVDGDSTVEALRVAFRGHYDVDEDDFTGETYFCNPEKEDGTFAKFGKMDKRECGFLYLRALRTGSRALSLERGSLLDIILKIKELRPKMWEDVLDKLRDTTVADDPDLGVKEVLEGVQEALKEFVPADWGSEPHLKVTDLTRESLRKTLTVFMSTGSDDYYAPFHHQGTGTVNTMVLALLSMIAEMKDTVIFAMEEPEIAIPPYTQKRIVNIVRKKANQALFTSHSPFVLEEFEPEQICLINRKKGKVHSTSVSLPDGVKPKTYRSEFRAKFAEALLAKRVLITEGVTEAAAYSGAAKKLEELHSNYSSLEALGIAIFNAGSDTAISKYGAYFKGLKKTTFAVFDKQEEDTLKEIKKYVDHPYELPYKGFEALIIEEVDIEAQKRFLLQIVEDGGWPSHLAKIEPKDTSTNDEYKNALMSYLKWAKGAAGAADLLGDCTLKEMPKTLKATLKDIKKHI